MREPTMPAGEPLVIAEQGHFFTGLREHTGPFGTAVTGTHVQYQVPRPVRHENALVLVHGGGGQALDYLATPDGRPGWATLFALDGYATYAVDRPGMGRSPYHPDLHGPPSPPAVYGGFVARFAAPTAGHTQWAGSGERGDPALEQFLAGQEPLPADLAAAHDDMRRGAVGLLDRIGPAVLVTHSLGGAFGWLAAAARPELVKAIVAVEPAGPPFATLGRIGALTYGLTAVPLEARFAGLGVAVVTAEASGHADADHATAEYLREAGADVAEIRLAELGIHGNGHLMMLERNNAEIAGAICQWLAARG
jgi:pimeloyl-ACP methyl ester carboxylesterase